MGSRSTRLGRPSKAVARSCAASCGNCAAASRPELSASAIGRDALVRRPDALGQVSRLPEDVDRNAAARKPIAADAQPAWLQQRRNVLADPHRAVLVKGAVVAK